MIQIFHTQNNKTRFFYVLYSDKTWVFDQSERAQGAIHIINENKVICFSKKYNDSKWASLHEQSIFPLVYQPILMPRSVFADLFMDLEP